MERKKIIETIIEYLSGHDASKIALFGSFARGEDTLNSDIDVIVNFRKRISLLELVGLELELSEIIGKKVELISERAINPIIRPFIDNDITIVLE